MMDERLNTTEDARPVIRKKCIVETVLEIIGGAMVNEDSVWSTRHLRSAVSPPGGLPGDAADPRAAVEAGNAGDQATRYCATQG
jgi:hypothetical protein